jgi:hypothetical protein
MGIGVSWQRPKQGLRAFIVREIPGFRTGHMSHDPLGIRLKSTQKTGWDNA